VTVELLKLLNKRGIIHLRKFILILVTLVLIGIIYVCTTGWIFPVKFEADVNNEWISNTWLASYLTEPDSIIVCHRKRITFSKWRLKGKCTIFNGKDKFVEGNINNGAWEGKVISWHKNGSVSGVEYYKNGLPYGTTLDYDKNGNKIREVSYLNGEKNGDEIYYDSNGLIVAIYIWKDGSIDRAILYDNKRMEKVLNSKEAMRYYLIKASGGQCTKLPGK
jgi:hypothetical protein